MAAEKAAMAVVGMDREVGKQAPVVPMPGDA